MLTAVFACGFVVARLKADEFSTFSFSGLLLGSLTALVAVGLIQQIFSPDDGEGGTFTFITRRLCLAFILFCMGLAFYLDQHPLQEFEPEVYLPGVDDPAPYAIAYPMWLFSLVLGALTAPWMNGPARVGESTTSPMRRIVSFVSTVAIIVYGFVSLCGIGLVPALIDIAIQGVEAGRFQALTVGTDDYVDWFSRTPEQLEHFVDIQMASFPPLFLAGIVAVYQSQRLARSTMVTLLTLVLIAILSIPAINNVAWLYQSGARQTFPTLVDTFWQEPRHDLQWAVIPLLLTALLLTVSRTNQFATKSDQDSVFAVASDHILVGWLFISVGIMEVVSVYQETTEYNWFTGKTIEITQRLWWTLSTCLGDFEESLGPIFVAFGCIWIWRKWRHDGTNLSRWPQPQPHHLVWFPVISILLSLIVVLLIPFGIALCHSSLWQY